MIRTKSNVTPDSGWNVAFWFAVLSPLISVLLGLLAPFIIYR